MSSRLALGITIGATVSSTVGRAFGSLDDRATRLGQSLRRVQLGRGATQSVIQYREQLSRLRGLQQQFGVGNTRLWGQIGATERALRDAERAARGYGVNIGDITRANQRLIESERRVQRQLQRTQVLQRNRNTRGNLQGQLLGAVGAAVAVTAPLKVAINFEQSIAKLAAITSADKQQKAQLQASARKFGRTTQFTASESAAAMTFLGMTGFKTNEILAATPGILDLAQASSSDLASTADVASNILSGFSLKASEMGRVGDVLAKTLSTSNVNLAQLGETMKYAASSASAVGGTIGEVAAMAGLLGNVGIQGSMAGTAIKAAYLRISGNKRAKSALRQLGIEASDSTGKMKAMPLILKEISAATEGMGDTQKLATISTIFGAEAASSMIELTKQAGSGELDKYIAKVNASMGTSAAMAHKMGATTQGSLKRMGSAFESVQISLGGVLLPTLAQGADDMAGLLGTVSAGAEAFPLLTQVVVGATVGLVALKVVTLAGGYALTLLSDGMVFAGGVIDFFRLSTLRANAALVTQRAIIIGTAIRHKALAGWTLATTAAQWLWNTATGVGSMTNARYVVGMAASAAVFVSTKAAIVGATAAQWLLNAAMSANPIGLIIVGVAAFGALAYTVYKKWEPIKQFFKDLWATVKIVGSAVGSFFGAGDETEQEHPEAVKPESAQKKRRGRKNAAAVLGVALAAPATAALPADFPAAKQAAAPVMNNQQYHVTVNQLPGEDTEQLARRITEIQQESAMRGETDVR